MDQVEFDRIVLGAVEASQALAPSALCLDFESRRHHLAR